MLGPLQHTLTHMSTHTHTIHPHTHTHTIHPHTHTHTHAHTHPHTHTHTHNSHTLTHTHPHMLTPTPHIHTQLTHAHTHTYTHTHTHTHTQTHTHMYAYTVLSRKSAHGRCILLSHQTGGWALFRVFPHLTLKERPPLFTYTSSAIAAIEQQARVSQSPPSTSTSLESLATSRRLRCRQALAEVQRGGRGAVVSTGKPGNTHGHHRYGYTD